MKTVLVTSVPPNRKFSGTLLTWHLAKNFTEKNLLGFFIANKHLKHVQAEFPNPGNYKCEQIIKTREVALRHKYVPTLFSATVSIFREAYRKYFEIPKLGKKLITFAKEQSADKIWIILEGQTMIWLADYLIRKNTFPVYSQVWDSPEWWVSANRLDWMSAKSVCKSYKFAIKNSAGFGSASYNMSELYSQRHETKSFPLIGITPDVNQEIPPTRKPNKFIIGVAGQVYATDAFLSLIEALDSAYWTIDGKEVEIHYWGSSDLRVKRTRIFKRGYVSQEQLCSELSSCDVLYCPYWFYRSFEEVVRTSFPSKITSYLKSGVIVLFHGPEYSSPSILLNQHNAALCCNTLDPEALKLKLRESIYLKDKKERLLSAKKLGETLLGEKQLHENFRAFMNIAGPK
jgi:hypothetical protein